MAILSLVKSIHNPVAVLAGNYNTVSFTALLDESSAQTCDGSQSYS